MTEKTKLYEGLRAPFPTNKIKWRVGARAQGRAIALAYIDARDVMNRLDETVGFDSWQSRPISISPDLMTYEISIRIGSEWITKSDGAGPTDIEAEKGSLSDAFKRAAVHWGIGRYLYYLPTQWHALTDDGKRFANEADIKLPEWATPEGWKRVLLRKEQYTEESNQPLTKEGLKDAQETIEEFRKAKGPELIGSILKQMTQDPWTHNDLRLFIESAGRLPDKDWG